MATVLLLRHGRTTTNTGGTLAGHQPVELDDVGRDQARSVGARLATVGITLAAVVSSPLVRCRQTVAGALPEAAVTVDDRLIECGYGDWTGQPLKKLAKDPLWRVVQAHPSAARFPGVGGEAMADMQARAVAAIREWDAKVSSAHGPDAVWLACSHGDVIKSIVADALGMHLDLFQRITADPGSITAIRYTPLRPFLLRGNDTGGDLGYLLPPKRPRRRRSGGSSDAPVGGGAGAVETGTAASVDQ